MFHQHRRRHGQNHQIVIPVQGGFVIARGRRPGEPISPRRSMAFARMLAPHDVITGQFHGCRRRRVDVQEEEEDHDDDADDDSYDDDDDTDICAICRGSGDGDGDTMTALPCGHSFHYGCITSWFQVLARARARAAAEAGAGELMPPQPSPAPVSATRPSATAPTCPMCRRRLVYACGHPLDHDGIRLLRQQPQVRQQPSELSHDDDDNDDKSQATPPTDTLGTLPLGWIIAWAVDGVGIEVEPPSSASSPSASASAPASADLSMLGHATWDQHLGAMLGYLSRLARSRTADRKLTDLEAQLARLWDALARLRRLEERLLGGKGKGKKRKRKSKRGTKRTDGVDRMVHHSPCSAPSSSTASSSSPLAPVPELATRARLGKAREEWEAAFAEAQRDLEDFLSLEEVLCAGRRLHALLDEESWTATHLPYLWRYRRRELGLPPLDATPATAATAAASPVIPIVAAPSVDASTGAPRKQTRNIFMRIWHRMLVRLTNGWLFI